MNARVLRLGRRLIDWGPRIIQALTLAISLTVIVLLIRLGMGIDWRAVLHAAHDLPRAALVEAGALVMAGYAAYAAIDCLARHFLRHDQTLWKTLAIAAASYAFNLNFGVLLGSVAVRLRLYGKVGLRHTDTAGVVLFGSVSNWLGYCWLGGAFFVGAVPDTLTRWGVPPALTETLGVMLVLAACVYLYLCATLRHRRKTVLGFRLALPTAGMALAQSSLAVISWNMIAWITYLLLEQRIPYVEVLGITLLSSIASVVAHVPGGLGVIEAVFVNALAGRLETQAVLAAILAYRLLYQWIPLGIALAGVAIVELTDRHGTCCTDTDHLQEDPNEK
jgi:uncharacterized membrane protein YbhN (UPF0104 family)